jgi:hypothetical protein
MLLFDGGLNDAVHCKVTGKTVKLSFRLTEHYVMQTYQAYGGSGEMCLHFLDLDTR